MRKLALLLAVVFLLAIPSASQAQEPILNVCDFPITVETSRDKEIFRELPGVANAPFLATVTGQLFAVVTNLENGKSVEVNISGPAFLTEESAVLTGSSLFFFPSP